MRKGDREVKDFNKILELIDKCQVLRLGLRDSGYPYVVPLSFGFEVADGKPVFYFHCAKDGKKTELIASDNRVCAEFDVLNGYKKTERGVTADYESVIAFGRAEEVTGDEAVRGIELLLEHCGVAGYSARQCVLMGLVAVYRITADEITAKKRFL